MPQTAPAESTWDRMLALLQSVIDEISCLIEEFRDYRAEQQRMAPVYIPKVPEIREPTLPDLGEVTDITDHQQPLDDMAADRDTKALAKKLEESMDFFGLQADHPFSRVKIVDLTGPGPLDPPRNGENRRKEHISLN